MILSLEDLGLPSDVLLWKAVLLTVISLAVGVLGGFVGMALGTIRLPALLLLGVPPAIAAGTNIIVSTASSLTGAVGHLRARRVLPRLAVTMGAPSVVGAFVGGFYGHLVDESLLILVVGVLVLWQGVELVNRARKELAASAADDAPVESVPAKLQGVFDRRHVTLAAAMGLVIGVAGGAVGLILGSLRIPAMVQVLKVEPRAALGTNMVIGFFMGATGWIGHVARGHVDYPLAFLMAASAMVGVHFGVKLTGKVSLGRLIMTLGLVMVVVGALLIVRAAST